MVLPKPWCTKDPRPCIKVIGLTEIFMSVVGAVMLVTLPFILMDLDHEYTYIKQYHLGTSSLSAGAISPDQMYYSLIVTVTSRYDCNELAAGVRRFLDEYLKEKVYYAVTINQTKILIENDNTIDMQQRIFCELHVRTKRSPTTKVVVVKNEKYSVSNIVAECISKYTGEKQKDVENKMTIFTPSNDKIADLKIYPAAIGSDPERLFCIRERVLGINTQEALDIEQLMYRLLGTSTLLSMVAGFLLTAAGFTVSRILLMLTFFIDCLSIGFMAGGIVLVNEPALCLFQYGGISVDSLDTPKYMQTILTYTCSIYIAAFKFYCLWFLLSYGEIVPKLMAASNYKSPDHSDYVAEMAKEVQERNDDLRGSLTDTDDEEENGTGDDATVFSDSDNNNKNEKSNRKNVRDLTTSSKPTSPRLTEKNSEGNIFSTFKPLSSDDRSKLRLRDVSSERSHSAIFKEEKAPPLKATGVPHVGKKGGNDGNVHKL